MSNSSEGDGNEGGGQAKATRVMATVTSMATMWAMVMATGKGRGARAMTTAMRVAGKEEGKGKGGKAMAMVTRVAGERTATLTKRAMATKTREKRGMARAAGAMAMVRKVAMVSKNDDNHDDGNNSNNDDNHNDNGVKDGENNDDADNDDEDNDNDHGDGNKEDDDDDNSNDGNDYNDEDDDDNDR